MSIMSGLVETGSPHPIAPHETVFSDWLVRHAWAAVLAGSVTFWVVLTGLLIWG